MLHIPNSTLESREPKTHNGGIIFGRGRMGLRVEEKLCTITMYPLGVFSGIFTEVHNAIKGVA